MLMYKVNLETFIQNMFPSPTFTDGSRKRIEDQAKYLARELTQYRTQSVIVGHFNIAAPHPTFQTDLGAEILGFEPVEDGAFRVTEAYMELRRANDEMDRVHEQMIASEDPEEWASRDQWATESRQAAFANYSSALAEVKTWVEEESEALRVRMNEDGLRENELYITGVAEWNYARHVDFPQLVLEIQEGRFPN